jgi:GT2 family glycosyltransferase
LKKIAVVILNWNGKSLLKEFLPSVILYSQEAHIYLADNNSSDDSIYFVKNKFPEITIIKNNANLGYAGGYNQALKEVKEPYFCLLNSDVEVTENWLQPIIQLFDNEPNTAIIQPKILAYNQKDSFEYAGAGGGFIDKYGFPFCRGRIFDTLEKDNQQYNDIKTIFWASGACFFIRKNVFEQLNGFDEDFFAHQEEIDLCWRAFNLNYEAKYCGKSVVYHLGGGTLAYNNSKKIYLNFRNSLWMLVKNLPSNKLFSTLFIRMCFDGLASIYFFKQFNFKGIFSILKAHISFYVNFIKFYNKRNSNQNKKYYQQKSIVWNYYINQNKKFKD